MHHRRMFLSMFSLVMLIASLLGSPSGSYAEETGDDSAVSTQQIFEDPSAPSPTERRPE